MNDNVGQRPAMPDADEATASRFDQLYDAICEVVPDDGEAAEPELARVMKEARSGSREGERTSEITDLERAKTKTEALRRKRALVEEAEQIAVMSIQWKAGSDRLRAILDEYKSVRGVDRRADADLWMRFSKARQLYNRRRGDYLAGLGDMRTAAKRRKEEIVAEAEALSESLEWRAAARRYLELVGEWQAAGRAPKGDDDELWRRFVAAQERFVARRSELSSTRAVELAENAAKKDELLREAERIDPIQDLSVAQAQLSRILEQWDQIGSVPRERVQELETRLDAVEEKVRLVAERGAAPKYS